MIKDRIVEIGSKRVLLPERCSGTSESYSTMELLALLASDRHNVLITGETGTGKEMLADCVEQMTKRPKNKFQRLNCAGLDSNLVGSELFGHKKGAFTDALEEREGLLKDCDGGVLFLDEIGWLLPDLQARLLRFMETGEIRPIGADKIDDHRANVRIIAATNKDVNDDKVMIHDLRARFDFEVNLPPLRERAGDILWFLSEPGFLDSEDVFTGITLRTLVGILTNKWPGNIRELKKYCQRKVILNPITEQGNEYRHILENWHFGNYSTIDGVKDFAGLALSAYESYGKMTESARVAVNARRVAALLAGLLRGMDGWIRSSEKPAVVPLAVLHAAVNGELPECDDFDLMTALIKVFEVVDPKVGNLVNVTIRMLVHKKGKIDLADALSMILRVAEALRAKMSSELDAAGTGKFKRANGPVRPSQAFLDEIGMSGPGGVLFAMPAPPHGKTGIESVLDELCIVDPDRSIALLCNQGLSNRAISKKVDLKPTTVGEHLVELRRNDKLKNHLPKQSAGRKARTRAH